MGTKNMIVIFSPFFLRHSFTAGSWNTFIPIFLIYSNSRGIKALEYCSNLANLFQTRHERFVLLHLLHVVICLQAEPDVGIKWSENVIISPSTSLLFHILSLKPHLENWVFEIYTTCICFYKFFIK